MKQLKGTVFPTKRQRENGTFKFIDQQWYKKCTGPAHAEEPEGFAWLPATDKYFTTHKSGKMVGKLTPRCRLCANWTKLKNPGSHHGYVKAKTVEPMYREAVNRVGVFELARRAEVSRGHIESVIEGTVQHVQKRPVRAVLLQLTSMRRKKEISQSAGLRHRNDKRNHGDIGVCAGCGGPHRNITRGCQSCWDRWHRWFRDKKITRKQWEAAKREYND